MSILCVDRTYSICVTICCGLVAYSLPNYPARSNVPFSRFLMVTNRISPWHHQYFWILFRYFLLLAIFFSTGHYAYRQFHWSFWAEKSVSYGNVGFIRCLPKIIVNHIFVVNAFHAIQSSGGNENLQLHSEAQSATAFLPHDAHFV